MVRRAPPEDRVAAMFDSIVGRYDLLNDLLSLGTARWWRRVAAGSLRLPPGSVVLDLGCGTGRLAERLARAHRVFGVDVSHGMLLAARASVPPTLPVRFVRGSAFHLPFAERSLDGVGSAFVLRNLDDHPAAFSEAARVIRPGGRLVLLDLVRPARFPERWGFDAYFGSVAPLLGRLTGQPDAYRYLVGSLDQIPPRGDVCRMIEEAGFTRCSIRARMFGAVAVWSATRVDPGASGAGGTPARASDGA
jgi:demethylmenaquinone methyltransferase / 2-methoxy-6-polyprenyl-1,4-benzoquinol methylase